MNLPTFIVGALIAAAFIAIVVSSIKKRKAGGCSCSCGGSCGGCGMKGSCHGDSEK